MSPTPYTIQAGATLSRVMHLFQRIGLRHLPVVDNRNNVVGMITRKDITHHALDEALLRLHAQSTGTGANAAPSTAVQRLLSLQEEAALAATERPVGIARTSSAERASPTTGQTELHTIAGSE